MKSRAPKRKPLTPLRGAARTWRAEAPAQLKAHVHLARQWKKGKIKGGVSGLAGIQASGQKHLDIVRREQGKKPQSFKQYMERLDARHTKKKGSK